MKSLTHLYRTGRGPSSSHTMGPARAAAILKNNYPDADEYKIVLYSSLAKTGKGHLTDEILRQVLAPAKTEIIFDVQSDDASFLHPCAMDIESFKEGRSLNKSRVYSVGGGAIRIEGRPYVDAPEIYPQKNFKEIKEFCTDKQIRLWQYVEEMEGPEIKDYLREVWKTMQASINSGLSAEGTLPGGLNVQRRAGLLYNQYKSDESPQTRENRMVCAYAFAVAEENAGGGVIVTAPTCGACGVVPAVLYYHQQRMGLPEETIIRGLATGGVIGNIIKTNASISGAQCGCQAEIGTACCMASAALAEIMGMSLDQIEYSAEISMEHMLGLTCDPILGLVQIPCIERNAVAAMRSINAVSLANFLTDSRKISFDLVVRTMYETGLDINRRYRETAEGGLAKLFNNRNSL